MDEFKDHVKQMKYIVLSNDGFCNAYASLRSISDDIHVDHTTISKQLKINDHAYAYCISKETHTIYYIRMV